MKDIIYDGLMMGMVKEEEIKLTVSAQDNGLPQNYITTKKTY